MNIQAFNSHSVHAVSNNYKFDWEKVGTSINPSLALVNHSCDANSIRANVNKSSILVAAQHIMQGQEITDTYTVHFRTATLHERQYHTLKNYLFACDCDACANNWPLEIDIPDELPRIPNFDQEKIYVKRHGDKKEIVEEIVSLRRNIEKQMTSHNYSEALIAYQELCSQLEQHVRKPHAYFLQARAGISHCIWNLYCRQQKVIDDEDSAEDVTGRDGARSIYKNGFTEKMTENTALDLGENDIRGLETMSVEENERKKLIEDIKASLRNNSQLLSEIKQEHEKSKTTENRMQGQEKYEQCNNADYSSLEISKKSQINEHDKNKPLTETEKIVLESKLELDRINNEIKERKKKEWEEKEQKRLEEQEKKRIQKVKDIEEKLQQKKKEEMVKKELRLKEEEQKKMQKEAEFLKRQEEDIRRNEHLKKQREQKKKQEHQQKKQRGIQK